MLILKRINSKKSSIHVRRSITENSPATAEAWGGTISLRFGALDDPLMTAVLKRLLADPVSFLLTLYPKSLK